MIDSVSKLVRLPFLKTTFPMGPGHSYWKGLEDMQVIFHYLQAERIGLLLVISAI